MAKIAYSKSPTTHAEQVEKLKSIVGETIADLEKFQQKKGQWWVKEIEGFGDRKSVV